METGKTHFNVLFEHIVKISLFIREMPTFENSMFAGTTSAIAYLLRAPYFHQVGATCKGSLRVRTVVEKAECRTGDSFYSELLEAVGLLTSTPSTFALGSIHDVAFKRQVPPLMRASSSS